MVVAEMKMGLPGDPHLEERATRINLQSESVMRMALSNVVRLDSIDKFNDRTDFLIRSIEKTLSEGLQGTSLEWNFPQGSQRIYNFETIVRHFLDGNFMYGNSAVGENNYSVEVEKVKGGYRIVGKR